MTKQRRRLPPLWSNPAADADTNAQIIAAFDTPEEQAAVGGVSVHQYPWRFDAVASRFANVNVHLAQWETAGIGDFSVMSEWNIGSSPDASKDHLHDYGQAQNGALLEMMYHAMIAGIDMAAIWGVQQNNKTSLSANEGAGDIYAAGNMFAMMAADLPGTQAIGRFANSDESVVTYGFEDQDTVKGVCSGAGHHRSNECRHRSRWCLRSLCRGYRQKSVDAG